MVTYKWNYGTAGDRWPVASGDIWKVGNHILACGDLEQGDGMKLLQTINLQPDMVYVDPPWNAGNACSFRTKAGVSRKVDFESFLQSLLNVVSRSQGDIYIEMGRQETERLLRLIMANGGKVMNVWGITYYRKNPCHLVRCTWCESHEIEVDFTGMDDDDTPAIAMFHSTQKGQWVFDPCLGRGLTSLVAQRLDRRCVGLELHPRRLACAIDKLHKAGLSPQKRGNL